MSMAVERSPVVCAAVVAMEPPASRVVPAARRFSALAGDHGGTVRQASPSMLTATFSALPDALEAAAALALGPDGTGLRCAVLTFPAAADWDLDRVVADAESLCRSTEPGHVVMAAAQLARRRAPNADSCQFDGIAGRSAELVALLELLSRADAGHAQVVTLAGPLGSGRSTLLRHLADVARTRGFSVLAIAGIDSQLRERWTSLIAAKLTLAGAESTTRFADRLTSLPGDTHRDDKHDRAVLPGHRPDVARELLASAIALTEEHPLLIAIDDLDRVDEATRRALRFLTVRLGAERCLVIASAPASAEHHLGAEVIPLPDLPDPALADIIERDGPIDVMVLRRCVTLAAGNPLAAREMSRSLSPRQRSGIDSLPAVPEPAAAVLVGFRELLGGVSDSARRAAVVAAADDTGESGVIRAALTTLGEDASGLEEAEDAGLLRVDGSLVRFAHPLLRSVAYHQVAPRSRRAAHGSLAGALSRPRQAAARAFQLAAAADGPSEPAAEALALVAQGEERRGDPVASARAMSTAAQLTADDDVRADRHLRAAVLYLRAGAPGSAESQLAEFGDLWANPDALVASCLTELARLGPARPRRRLDHATVTDHLRPVVEALAAYLSALAGDPPDASANAGRLGAAARALAGASDASPLRDATPSSTGALGALETSVVAAALAEGGWMADAAQAVDDLDRLATAVDPVLLRATAGMLALESGRPLAALESLTDGSPGGSGGTASDCTRLLALGRVHLYTGRLHDAEGCLRQATTLLDRLGLGLHEGEADRLAGLLLHAQGREEGLDLLDRACRKRPDRALADYVLAVLERGATPSPARESRLRSLAQSPDPRVSLGAHRALAAMIDDIDSLDDLARQFEAAGLVLESVLTRGARVSAAVRAGKATALTGQDVAELGRRYGLVCPGTRYWGLGSPPDPVRERLTRSEHRVAVTVGAGASNKVAAEELFVSTKTVDYHLQNIYRKLDIRSRTELAVLLAGVRATEDDRKRVHQ